MDLCVMDVTWINEMWSYNISTVYTCFYKENSNLRVIVSVYLHFDTK